MSILKQKFLPEEGSQINLINDSKHKYLVPEEGSQIYTAKIKLNVNIWWKQV